MLKPENKKSALTVQPCVEPPAQVNAEAVSNLKSRTSSPLSTAQYLNGILSGNRAILSKAITLVESSRPDHQEQARAIIAACLREEGRRMKDDTSSDPASGIRHPASTLRIGITGVPGVGKSTFIETLGKHITGLGYKLAVLAVDPSSTVSKGSILADKTRMERLSVDPNAFIRPSPSAGTLGGVARKTRETIYLCEAAGFDVIFIETVGVGQSETTVKSMVDFFLLLMLAGAGDEMQGIKRGIVEMADAIVINKADGDNIPRATVAAMDFTSALRLFPPSTTGWVPTVDMCSSKTGEGIPRVWEVISAFHTAMNESGHFIQNRTDQNQQVFHQAIDEKLRDRFYRNADLQEKIRRLEKKVIAGTLNPYQAAGELFHP